MNRYWKLINWEINRFAKFYVVLLVVTLLSQLAGVLLFSKNFMSKVDNIKKIEFFSESEYVAQYGLVHFKHYTSSHLLFMAPIGLCAAALILYVFLIWYQEWFGKNTFAYRLLMLPTSRMNVYFAKLTAILLFVFGLIAFQLMILPMQILVFNSIIPSGLRESVSPVFLSATDPILGLLIPRPGIDFLVYYSIGIMAVIVIFTAILLERSYRVKGIIAGAAYGTTATLLFLSPILITETWFPQYFYPNEFVVVEMVVGILIIGVSLWFSAYLINKKIAV